ncbi:MAG: hypothetical protein IKK34_10705 [Clostridia bacterium]|nr:hypothetical protein [Clostridia bacterium]
MAIVSVALALLSGVVGAGFASGREILCFFARHGAGAGAAVVCALLSLSLLFLRLPAQLERMDCPSLSSLCRHRFGARLGALCALLFSLLFAITGGAMLAACAELSALVLNVRHAYGIGMVFSLLLGALLASRGLYALALPGAALCLLLPALLLRLLAQPMGEACFLPAMSPDMPVRAVCDGAIYGALNAAQLAGTLPLLRALGPPARRRAVLLFSALFGALLLLGVAVCRRHFAAIVHQPLPFVYLSRRLGPGGYLLVAACLYAAALSTFCAMLAGLRMLPLPLAALCCLLFAALGFGDLIASAYPVLGALCSGLLLLLCMPQSLP